MKIYEKSVKTMKCVKSDVPLTWRLKLEHRLMGMSDGNVGLHFIASFI